MIRYGVRHGWAALIDFHPVLRRHAAVPADQVIVCGRPITSFARFYDS
jgi:hypothetical protein